MRKESDWVSSVRRVLRGSTVRASPMVLHFLLFASFFIPLVLHFFFLFLQILKNWTVFLQIWRNTVQFFIFWKWTILFINQSLTFIYYYFLFKQIKSGNVIQLTSNFTLLLLSNWMLIRRIWNYWLLRILCSI